MGMRGGRRRWAARGWSTDGICGGAEHAFGTEEGTSRTRDASYGRREAGPIAGAKSGEPVHGCELRNDCTDVFTAGEGELIQDKGGGGNLAGLGRSDAAPLHVQVASSRLSRCVELFLMWNVNGR